ncbi:MAG: GHKL domain-containing protein [Desulfobacteraceae bacterium]|nr:GHKL domain-containing protein [Desulfobacteraceae bacterium]MBU4002610.1 GHKL domain-containing protein [Pseudomonadota bacterium]MBU4053060.1 GHKL domain-containing protein [Pseudomonadota bacterium]
MKSTMYRQFSRTIIFFTLLVSLMPLVLLGGIIYYNFAKVYRENISDQIQYRANSQAKSIDVFLGERVAVLSTLADTHSYDFLKNPENLARMFEIVRRRTSGFVDIGLINDSGDHVAYSGPYALAGLNYFATDWFDVVMRKGQHVSDVFMGFRKSPHFIIAVRGITNGKNWILRTTIDPDIFQNMVQTAQIGRSGDAFIINRDGLYQTDTRFSGHILEKSNIDPSIFGAGTPNTEKMKIEGKKKYYAGAWLKNNDWLLVISQESGEEMGGLLATRNFAIIILVLGCAAIIYTTIATTRMTVKKLEQANKGIDELNSQLMQSDKLAALGKMAAGIAHEINNPLAVIGEKAGWMRDLLMDEEFKNSENFREYSVSIDKIEEHVERARKITHNMLGFIRKMEPRLDDVDVNQVLIQTTDLLQNQARLSNITIRKDLQPGIPIVASDQSQLQQVFLNLITNAIDAVEGVHKKEGFIDIRTWNNAAHVFIEIEDDGPGIPKEYERKVFDPFFTTKETGKGTGLGLSISHNIIEKLGGVIHFENKTPHGAAFTIKLPLVKPERK